ncbi:MAG: aminoacyl-tRNA hydrolase [Deferribacteres bacterium]|nr:aminoacyl-tRNA hydrolase [candidate division KSB1 bacterium]MCB9502512.1 aminoacyl-tRNA hydrolase [Deferribacteres bacterium]
MYLICGLGNPGTKYELTRHNIGFMVVDELARRNESTFRSGRGNYLYAKTMFAAKDTILLKPMTYMNLSGDALRHAADYWQIENENILIISDDYHIPFSQIRIRAKGRDGGHNGLASVIQCMNTVEIPRLRMGIGSEHQIQNSKNYVLANFTTEERNEIAAFTEQAAGAVIDFIENGILHAMNQYNTK